MKYFRVHTADIAYITQQPRGIFTAVGKLVDAKRLTAEEEKQYWENRAYFEKVLPMPPFYAQGNPDHAITWFKDNEKGKDIWRQMAFYREMCQKYNLPLFRTDCDALPGEVIYEDEFQIAVKNQKSGLRVQTAPLTGDGQIKR